MSRNMAYNVLGLIIVGIIICAFIWPLPTLATVATIITIREATR